MSLEIKVCRRLRKLGIPKELAMAKTVSLLAEPDYILVTLHNDKTVATGKFRSDCPLVWCIKRLHRALEEHG